MSQQRVIFGYYTYWSKSRIGNGRFSVADIDTSLVTHLSYAFLQLNEEDGSINPPRDKEALHQLVELKKRNPNLKVLASLGGWQEGSTKYSRVTSLNSKRHNLVKSAIKLMDDYHLDGLDLCWMYPCERGGAPVDKVNFVTLLRELKHALGKDRLLTVAVAATSWRIDISYDVPEVNKIVDMINVLSYDFHSHHNGHVGHNTPLYTSNQDISRGNSCLSIDAGIQHLLNEGADAQKINLGLSTYGRCFTLRNAANHGAYAPTSGPGDQGPYTHNPGTLGYMEILELCNDWTKYRDDHQKVPYRIHGRQLLAYDDPESIKVKVNYAKEMGLGGVTVWSLDLDDFHNGYPLVRAIHEA